MKSPLRYLVTEFDTGAVSLINGLSFLFERDEMPAELLRVIQIYSLDSYNAKGFVDKTSTRNVLFSVSKWVESFAKQKNIPLKSKYLKENDVTIYQIVDCLKQNGCVCLKTYLGGEKHFVVLTAIDEEYVYLFDPYFKPSVNEKYKSVIHMINDNPFAFNRSVNLEYFLTEKKSDLTLGAVAGREMVMFFRDDSSRERELV